LFGCNSIVAVLCVHISEAIAFSVSFEVAWPCYGVRQPLAQFMPFPPSFDGAVCAVDDDRWGWCLSIFFEVTFKSFFSPILRLFLPFLFECSVRNKLRDIALYDE